jgi:hypothetical protein
MLIVAGRVNAASWRGAHACADDTEASCERTLHAIAPPLIRIGLFGTQPFECGRSIAIRECSTFTSDEFYKLQERFAFNAAAYQRGAPNFSAE